MARWKARVELLISVIELLFLSLTSEVLQGKTCQNSQFQEGVSQFEPTFQGEGSSPQGQHVAPMAVKFGTEADGDKFHSISATIGYRTLKTEIFTEI